MAVKKKDSVNLIHQAESFLDYSENIWKITRQVKKDILDVLRRDDVDISDKNSIKNKLSWVVSEKKFDELYSDYSDYNKHAVVKLKKYFEDVKLFPEWYESLSTDLAISCVRYWTDISSLEEDLTFEKIEEIREWFARNISIIEKNLWIGVSDLWKFIDLWSDSDIDEDSFAENVRLFKQAWITSVQDFVKVSKLLVYRSSEDIKLFVDMWIKSADDFVKLDDNGLIRSSYPENIKLFKSVWINTADDLIKLWWLINNSSSEEHLKLFIDAWIKSVDDFLKLRSFIISSSYYTWNIKLFLDMWIKSADDFLKLKDMILHYRFSDPQKLKIEMLFGVWINTADDILKLKDIIYGWNVDNLKIIFDALKSNAELKLNADDVLWLEALVGYWTSDYYNNIKLFVDIWINSIDDFLKLEDFLTWRVLSDDQIYKIKILFAAWISTVDDILDLKDIIYSWYSESLELLLGAWINKTDDLLQLKEIINSYYCMENLQLFTCAGICKVDDLLNLKDFIFKFSTKILEVLVGAWFSKVDDFLQLEDKINYRDSENVKNNIETFKSLWITKVSDLLKLKDCIFTDYRAISKWVELLQIAKISSVDDFLKIREVMSWEEPGNFLEKLPEIAQKTWIIFDDKLITLSNYIIENYDSFSYYWNIGNVQDNILFLYYEAWYSLDDIKDNLNLLYSNTENLRFIYEKYCDENITLAQLLWLQDIVFYAKLKNLKVLFSYYPDVTIEQLTWLTDMFGYDNLNIYNFELVLKYFGPMTIDDIKLYKKIFLFWWNLPINLEFKEEDNKEYLKYIWKLFDICDGYYLFSYDDMKSIVSNLVKFSFWDVENYLNCLKSFCIDQNHPYNEFLICFDGKEINNTALKFLSKWFDVSWPNDRDGIIILNNAINNLYPNLNIKFNEFEAKKIIDFIDGVWWVNKWYSILILTMEKMIRDWVDSIDFNRVLCEKLDNYKKIFDLYPEDKIPDWLKISIWIEFEINHLYAKWFNDNFWLAYYEFADQIVKNAKVGIERWDWAYEFATKPSTSPMVALLEMHLLHELDLFDLNGIRKIWWKYKGVNYASRDWTWYHLNIWSDSEICVDENIKFIQNLCTILPRSWILNWSEVSEVNRINNLNYREQPSKLFMFPNSNSKRYIELRTYSIDDVELFEKNVLFNTYAIMWSQAQKKVSNVQSEILVKLKDNDNIVDSNSLMNYLEQNNLFKVNQDIKSKKVAAEFMFMQICVLRAISDYNKNFIDNELFGIDEVSSCLNDSWRNYFMDLLCLDNGESIWYNDDGHSSRFVKFKCKKLYSAFVDGTFSFTKYLDKNEPFSDVETKKILDKYWEIVDDNKLSLVTLRLNKRLLREKLIIWCEDTQNLEKSIAEKKMNIDRIRSNIRWMDQTLRVDKQYLQDYFKTNMSLSQFNPYHSINTDFMNKIINLNNFFLKKDDTNANGVLQTTILYWDKGKEEDISKFSIFEKWKMREWYNYYQWWTKDMLLHKAQTIALNYMENVRNILNTDFSESKTTYKAAA